MKMISKLFPACGVLAIMWTTSSNVNALTLDEVVRQALRNNFDIRIETLTPQIAVDEWGVSQGVLDPTFFMQSSYESAERLQNAVDLVSTNVRMWAEENWRFESGVAGKMPWGMDYKFSANLDVLDNEVNRRQFSLMGNPDLTAADPNLVGGPIYSPEYESFVGMTLNQPLLRGRGRDSAQMEQRVARREINASELVRRIVVTNKLVEVVNAFYDLHFAEENLRVKEAAVALADRFQSEASRKLEIGRASEIDVVRADVKVSEAREEVIIAEDFRRDRQIALMQLIEPKWTAESTFEYYEVEAEFSDVRSPANLRSLTEEALTRRPDVLLAGERMEQEMIRERYSRNRTLPVLDLQFRYGISGYGGDVGDSFTGLSHATEPTWAAGVVFSMPLGNRQGKSEARLAKRRLEQADLAIEKARTEVALQVLNSSRRIDTFRQRLETALKSRELAERALAAEERRYENGMASSVDVLDLQTQLSASRTRELAAKVDMQKAEAELWSVSGRLLDELRVELADAGDIDAARFRLFR